MARARNIKPAFFKNELLAEAPFQARLLFIGLWTLADREGRMEDRPKRIRMEIFPADDVDTDAMLDILARLGFIIRYEIAGERYISITQFLKHQQPHIREAPSTIPAPTKDSARHNLGGCEAQPRSPESPILNPESPILNPSLPEPAVSLCGAACLAMRKHIPTVNPSDPRLKALIQAGATTEEFEYAAQKAIGKANAFAYVLKIVESRRQEAASIAANPGKSPTKPMTEKQQAIAKLLGSRAPGAKKERIING